MVVMVSWVIMATQVSIMAEAEMEVQEVLVVLVAKGAWVGQARLVQVLPSQIPDPSLAAREAVAAPVAEAAMVVMVAVVRICITITATTRTTCIATLLTAMAAKGVVAMVEMVAMVAVGAMGAMAGLVCQAPA